MKERKEKKRKEQREREREREKRRGRTCPRRERERERGTEGMASMVTVYGARRLVDRLDLAPARDRGQQAEVRGRVELWVSAFLFWGISQNQR